MENRDHELYRDRKLVQNLLKYGLILAMSLMILGFFVNVLDGHIESAAVPLFELFSDSLGLGDRLLGLGVLALTLTPALRVVTLSVLWAKEKDWKFVGISFVVIVTLLVSVFVGGHS